MWPLKCYLSTKKLSAKYTQINRSTPYAMTHFQNIVCYIIGLKLCVHHLFVDYILSH